MGRRRLGSRAAALPNVLSSCEESDVLGVAPGSSDNEEAPGASPTAGMCAICVERPRCRNACRSETITDACKELFCVIPKVVH